MTPVATHLPDELYHANGHGHANGGAQTDKPLNKGLNKVASEGTAAQDGAEVRVTSEAAMALEDEFGAHKSVSPTSSKLLGPST